MLLAICYTIAGMAAPVNKSDLVAVEVHDQIREAGIILRQHYDATEMTIWHSDDLLKMPQAAAENVASMMVATSAATRLFELVCRHRCSGSTPPAIARTSRVRTTRPATPPAMRRRQSDAHLDDRTFCRASIPTSRRRSQVDGSTLAMSLVTHPVRRKKFGQVQPSAAPLRRRTPMLGRKLPRRSLPPPHVNPPHALPPRALPPHALPPQKPPGAVSAPRPH